VGDYARTAERGDRAGASVLFGLHWTEITASAPVRLGARLR
jgi:hypothetical protein